MNWAEIFEKSVAIRAFELEAAVRFDQGLVPGLLHLAMGSEVLAILLAYHLDSEIDKITGSHRSHALALAAGLDPVAVAGELMGLESGLSDGKGGTQHLLSPSGLFLTSNGIVGGQVPLALGAALSAKQLSSGGIAVAVLGDGALNQGAVLESFNLAAALGLPVLFVVDNNGMAQDTPAATVSAGGGAQIRARAFGLACERVEGSKLQTLDDAIARLSHYVRAGQSPALLEVMNPLLSGHYYAGEISDFSENDPLATAQRLAQQADKDRFEQAGIDHVKTKASSQAKAIFDAALATSHPQEHAT